MSIGGKLLVVLGHFEGNGAFAVSWAGAAGFARRNVHSSRRGEIEHTPQVVELVGSSSETFPVYCDSSTPLCGTLRWR